MFYFDFMYSVKTVCCFSVSDSPWLAKQAITRAMLIDFFNSFEKLLAGGCK